MEIEEKKTYSVEAECTNCGWTGTVEVERGQFVCHARCPNCDCEKLKRCQI